MSTTINNPDAVIVNDSSLINSNHSSIAAPPPSSTTVKNTGTIPLASVSVPADLNRPLTNADISTLTSDGQTIPLPPIPSIDPRVPEFRKLYPSLNHLYNDWEITELLKKSDESDIRPDDKRSEEFINFFTAIAKNPQDRTTEETALIQSIEGEIKYVRGLPYQLALGQNAIWEKDPYRYAPPAGSSVQYYVPPNAARDPFYVPKRPDLMTIGNELATKELSSEYGFGNSQLPDMLLADYDRHSEQVDDLLISLERTPSSLTQVEKEALGTQLSNLQISKIATGTALTSFLILEEFVPQINPVLNRQLELKATTANLRNKVTFATNILTDAPKTTALAPNTAAKTATDAAKLADDVAKASKIASVAKNVLRFAGPAGMVIDLLISAITETVNFVQSEKQVAEIQNKYNQAITGVNLEAIARDESLLSDVLAIFFNKSGQSQEYQKYPEYEIGDMNKPVPAILFDESQYLGDGKDRISDLLGNDRYYGAGGNDILDGGSGHDLLDGGLGNDKLSGSKGDDSLYGWDGNDTLDGGEGSDELRGERGNDRLSGGMGNDIVSGGKGNDIINEDSGSDIIFGGEGFDWAIYQSPVSSFSVDYLSDGTVTVKNTTTQELDFLKGVEHITFTNYTIAISTGTLDNDTFNISVPTSVNETIVLGGEGNDILYGGEGNDVFDGGTGTDRAIYQGYSNEFAVTLLSSGEIQIQDQSSTKGNEGTDRLTNVEQVIFGGSYYEVVTGSSGSDVFNTTSQSLIVAGGGDDSYTTGTGKDLLLGGTGNDSLWGMNGDDRLFGEEGIDRLEGGEGSDFINGGTGNDTLLGWMHNDTLVGGDGNDYVSGELENDQLTGGKGSDFLAGGTGADRFIFNSLSEGIDRIYDFKSIEGDKIQISGSGFGATSTSQFTFNFSTRALSFNGQQFATLQNIASTADFAPSQDLILV